MSLPDTIFIFALALVIFGPKKLPEIGRQLGKLVLEFRRASNEFKMQIEDELRTAEESDRQKKIAAQNSAPATAASDELTIRPPSSGTVEKAEAPFKAYFAQGESPQTEVKDLEIAKSAAPESEVMAPEVREPAGMEPGPPEPEIAPAEQTSSIVRDSQGALGDYERVVSSHERTAADRDGLEEQTAHHHG